MTKNELEKKHACRITDGYNGFLWACTGENESLKILAACEGLDKLAERLEKLEANSDIRIFD